MAIDGTDINFLPIADQFTMQYYAQQKYIEDIDDVSGVIFISGYLVNPSTGQQTPYSYDFGAAIAPRIQVFQNGGFTIDIEQKTRDMGKIQQLQAAIAPVRTYIDAAGDRHIQSYSKGLELTIFLARKSPPIPIKASYVFNTAYIETVDISPISADPAIYLIRITIQGTDLEIGPNGG